MNRDKKMNAFTFEMFDRLEEVFNEIQSEGKDVRAVVLAANGKHFSAGLDLNAAAEMGQ